MLAALALCAAAQDIALLRYSFAEGPIGFSERDYTVPLAEAGSPTEIAAAIHSAEQEVLGMDFSEVLSQIKDCSAEFADVS